MPDKLTFTSPNLSYELEGLLQNDYVCASQAWRRLKRLGLDAAPVAPPPTQMGGPKGEMPLFAAGMPNLLVNLQNVTVDLKGIKLPQTSDEYALKVISCSNVRILNCELSGAANAGVLVSACKDVEFVGARIESSRKNALTVSNNSSGIRVVECLFQNNGGAGIAVCGGSSDVWIERCQIKGGSGKSNWTSGIVLTDRWVENTDTDCWDMLSADQYWAKEQPILDRTAVVRGCVIKECSITRNMASGIYMDGAIQCMAINNEITENSKEGICLDYGASLNFCVFNRLIGNGRRYGKSDDDLARDHVLVFGRMEDGTATAKVPAISLDNAVGNVIQHNTIAGNYGSGVKMVRASFLNSIAFNSILDNNQGTNHLHHFFGVEAGAAVLDVGDPNEFQELDCSPSSSNVVHANIIKGNHYAGLFLAHGTEQNHVFDNIILDPAVWSMESVDYPSTNVSLNNIGFKPSKGIGLSRLVPQIVGLGMIES